MVVKSCKARQARLSSTTESGLLCYGPKKISNFALAGIQALSLATVSTSSSSANIRVTASVPHLDART
jgi:hypothetical protein